MKWCMVAAMAVSLLFGGVAQAQEDNFDLDALLGEVDSATPPAEAAAPAAVEEAAAPVDESVAADPFADFADEAPASDAAPIEEAAPVAAEEADVFAAEEEAVASPAEDDMLGDLFADEPAPAFDAEPVAEEPVPAFEEAGGDFDADFGEEESAFAAPVAAKKAGKEVEKLPAKEIKKIAKETAQQEEVRRQAAEADALKASEIGFRALSDGDLIAAENSFSAALKGLPDRPQNAAVREQISWGLAEAQYLRARGMVQKNERLADARKLVDSALKNAPTHRGAQALSKRLAKLEILEARPKAPGDQPATLEKAKTLDQMYDEARQWYMLKDYDRATALFEKILVRDPYHKSAMRYLRKIEADKYKLATY